MWHDVAALGDGRVVTAGDVFRSQPLAHPFLPPRSCDNDRSKRLLIPLTFRNGTDWSAARLYQPNCTTVPSEL